MATTDVCMCWGGRAGGLITAGWVWKHRPSMWSPQYPSWAFITAWLLAPYLAFSHTPSSGGSLEPDKAGSLASPLCPYWHWWGWTIVFSVVFGWCRAVSVYKFSVLLGCSFLAFCWRQQAPSLGSMRQKENTGNSPLGWLFLGSRGP